MKQIIIIPKGDLTIAQIKEIQDQGLIVIASDTPEKVRVISSSDLISGDDIIMSAMKSVCSNFGGGDVFAKELNRRLLAKESAVGEQEKEGGGK